MREGANQALRRAVVAEHRTFLTLPPQRLGALIMGARHRVIYAAPSLSLDVSSALINVSERLGTEMVSVVLDVSEEVFRLGYGVVDALNLLHERKITLRHNAGLRISFVVVDNEGFIFSLPPLLVDGASDLDDRPNAVRASSDQIERLVNAVLPPPAQSTLQLDRSGPAKTRSPGQDALPLFDDAEIGQKVAPPGRIEEIDRAIQANPVENFDVARVVNVFAAHIQFYEFEVLGTQIQNQSVQLPKSLMASVRDKATRDRITAAFKLVANDSRVSGDKIRKKADAIRKRFIRHHPTYGGLILKTNRAALEGEIGELEELIKTHKQTVLRRFANDARSSIEELVRAFWRDIARAPPQDLVDQLGVLKLSSGEAKDYLRHILAAAFPKPDEVAERMRVTRVVKDVTWNTLNEPGFVEWLKAQFPLRKDLQQPFDLYRAAREALKSKQRQR
jgi:hypothetical protein